MYESWKLYMHTCTIQWETFGNGGLSCCVWIYLLPVPSLVDKFTTTSLARVAFDVMTKCSVTFESFSATLSIVGSIENSTAVLCKEEGGREKSPSLHAIGYMITITCVPSASLIVTMVRAFPKLRLLPGVTRDSWIMNISSDSTRLSEDTSPDTQVLLPPRNPLLKVRLALKEEKFPSSSFAAVTS